LISAQCDGQGWGRQVTHAESVEEVAFSGAIGPARYELVLEPPRKTNLGQR